MSIILRSLVLAICLLAPSFAEAQTVVAQLTNLSQTFREGTTTTNSVSVPANITETADEIAISLDIQTAVYEDPATRLTIRLYRLEPATQQWRMMSAGTFSGGRYVDEDGNVNPPITMSTATSTFAGYEARVEVETNARVRLGATVYTLKY